MYRRMCSLLLAVVVLLGLSSMAFAFDEDAPVESEPFVPRDPSDLTARPGPLDPNAPENSPDYPSYEDDPANPPPTPGFDWTETESKVAPTPQPELPDWERLGLGVDPNDDLDREHPPAIDEQEDDGDITSFSTPSPEETPPHIPDRFPPETPASLPNVAKNPSNGSAAISTLTEHEKQIDQVYSSLGDVDYSLTILPDGYEQIWTNASYNGQGDEVIVEDETDNVKPTAIVEKIYVEANDTAMLFDGDGMYAPPEDAEINSIHFSYMRRWKDDSCTESDVAALYEELLEKALDASADENDPEIRTEAISVKEYKGFTAGNRIVWLDSENDLVFTVESDTLDLETLISLAGDFSEGLEGTGGDSGALG